MIDHRKPVFLKLKTDLSGWFNHVLGLSWEKVTDQLHQGGFSASYRTRKENTFSQVDAVICSILLVPDCINEQFVDQFIVAFDQRKMVSKQDFAPFFHPLQAGRKTEIKNSATVIGDLLIGVQNNLC